MPDIVITPNRGTSTNPKIDFTGVTTGTIKLEVLTDGSLSFNGANGSLFSIADSVTGSLMSVNDTSGLPILEVFSTDKVVMGKYGQNTLVVDGTNNRVGIGTASPSDRLTIAGTSNNGISFTGATNATIYSSSNLIASVTNNLYLRPGSGYNVVVDTGSGLQVTSGDIRSPAFYYSADTSSRWVNGYQLILRGASPTIFFRDTDHNSAMIHVNSNIFYVLRGNGADSEGWTSYDSRWPLEIDLTNNRSRFGGQISVSSTAGGSMVIGTKAGAGYSDGVDGATFKSITDHPTGGSYAFSAYYNGSSGTNSFYVSSSGSGYFKETLSINQTTPVAKLVVNNEGTINTTTPGLNVYNIHFSPGTGATANYATGITFGANTGSGNNAQAGIYVQYSGSYGTKMYLATTDEYATGSKTAIEINHSGNVNIVRGALTQGGNQVLHAGNYTSYVGNGTLTLNTSGSGISGSTSFTANQSGNTTFTVTSNATTSNTASTIMLRGASNEIYIGDVYTANWLRVNGTNGLYAQDYGTHFYANSDLYWNIAGNNSQGNGALRFRIGHQGTVKGFVYWDANGFGLLNDAGNWAVRSNYSGQYSGGTLYGNWGKASANYTGGITIPGMFIQSGATTGTPTAIANGDLWWNTDTGKLNIWWSTANAWVVATPTPDMSQYYPVGGGNINGNASVSGLLTATGNITATSGGSYPMSIGNHPTYGSGYSALWRPGQDYAVLVDSTNTMINATSSGGTVYLRTANSNRAYADSNGNLFGVSSIRGPIFYDTDNTGYYVDPNSTTYLYNLILSGNSYFRPQTWIQFDGSYGVFWPNSYGAHLHANDLSTYTQIALRGSKNSYGGIYDQFSGVNGFMYDSSGNGGVYREGTGRWYLYHYVGNNCLGIGTSNTDATYSIYTDSKGARLGGYTQVVGNMDADAFRDRNNTAYYCDPASTSVLYQLNTNYNIYPQNYGIGLVGVYSSTRYQAVFSMGDSYKLPADGTTTGNLYGLAWSHPNAGGVAGNLNTHGLLAMENGTWLASVSGSIRCRDDMRAPIYYDSNNTYYYSDPNGVSHLGYLRLDWNWGSGDFSSEAFSITGTYASMCLRNTTSNTKWLIHTDSNGSIQWYYGGTWYDNSWSRYVQISNGEFHHVSAIKSPIFYDYDDTNYYVNPNGNCRINTVYANSLGVGTSASGTSGEIRATNNITAYYSDERLKTKLGPIENPIEKVKSLSGFYFEANETAVALGYQKKREVGVSAQEVQAILPEIVVPAPISDEYLTVRYEKLIPLLIEAIKDQQKQIDELKALLASKS